MTRAPDTFDPVDVLEALGWIDPSDLSRAAAEASARALTERDGRRPGRARYYTARHHAICAVDHTRRVIAGEWPASRLREAVEVYLRHTPRLYVPCVAGGVVRCTRMIEAPVLGQEYTVWVRAVRACVEEVCDAQAADTITRLLES